MDREQIYKKIDDYAKQICCECEAPVSHLPKKVIDWITDCFIADYEEKEPDKIPDKTYVLREMCDYLQENCYE